LPDGDWPRDSVNGVFFGTAMLDYRLYNTYFPTWALNLARATNRLRCVHNDRFPQ
jgi:lanosterol synthase